MGEGYDRRSRRDSGRSGQVRFCAAEAIRRIAERGSEHLGQPPVFPLDRKLCRLRRCRGISSRAQGSGMTRKSTNNVSQGKGLCIAKFPPRGLTCSEWQVDDVLSAGESTSQFALHTIRRTANDTSIHYSGNLDSSDLIRWLHWTGDNISSRR